MNDPAGLPERQRLALAAAAQASEATAELTRFCREGVYLPQTPFGEVEVVEKLADAMKLAIEVEGFEDPDTMAIDEERNELYVALCKFLSGWAG